MGKKDKLLLVDGENLLHRSFHKFENLRSFDGRPSGAIFGFFKSLNMLVYRFNPTSVIITFDNGRSSHRLEILPDYKGHRKNLKTDYESLQKQKKVIMRCLKHLGVPYIFDKEFKNQYEGDDYISYIKHVYEHDVLIVSSDKDFAQLICKRVKQFNPAKDVLVSLKNCKKVMGFEPTECFDYLCLLGDKSDNIPGYPGVGEVKTRKFLDTHHSIDHFLVNQKLEFSGIDREKLMEIHKVNKQLIDLKYFIRKHPIDMRDVPLVMGKFNKEKLHKILSKYSLTSLKGEEFLGVFKKLKVWRKE